jgi:F-type H+-transporting ATPase subunit b
MDPANWMPGLTALIVFGAAFLFLRWKVWPQIIEGLDDRQQKIRDEIAAAEDARAQANSALAEYERNLAEARKEATEMIAKARADAKAAAAELRASNETELAEMKERATRDIDSAKRAAVTELHAEAAGLAASIAGRILQRQISDEDQQRLLDESLREMGNMQRT